MMEVAHRFCTSPERVALLRGLLEYRADLRAAGIPDGLQWIDGSFCEDVETTRRRPPQDIDVVTLVVRPMAHVASPAWVAFVADHPHLFAPAAVKHKYGCDGYPLDLCLPLQSVMDQFSYWLGLFSHQRATNLWKGMLQVPLIDDDAAVAAYLNALPFTP
jgi:hypothetical protein